MPDGRSPFHRGEQALQSRLGVRDKVERLGQKVIHDHIPKEHGEFFSELPFLIVGSADDAGRLWASILVGRPGFMTASDPQTLAVKAHPIYGDPLSETMAEGAEIGALGIELHSRRRYRVNGKVVNKTPDGFEIAVHQSFYNCPKYILSDVSAHGTN